MIHFHQTLEWRTKKPASKNLARRNDTKKRKPAGERTTPALIRGDIPRPKPGYKRTLVTNNSGGRIIRRKWLWITVNIESGENEKRVKTPRYETRGYDRKSTWSNPSVAPRYKTRYG
jgi:hypothetical protein